MTGCHAVRSSRGRTRSGHASTSSAPSIGHVSFGGLQVEGAARELSGGLWSAVTGVAGNRLRRGEVEVRVSASTEAGQREHRSAMVDVDERFQRFYAERY